MSLVTRVLSTLVVASATAFGACGGEDVPLAVGGDKPTPTETESGGEDDGEEGIFPKLDIFGATSIDWFLHFPPSQGPNEFWEMMHIDLWTGKASYVCFISGTQDEPWPTSSTFTRDDRLMVSNGYSLWEISLPDCVGTHIATYPEAHGIINGIAPDAGYGLLGVSASGGELVAIDPDTGVVTPIGDFGFPLSGSHGATWVEAEQELYIVEGSTDALYIADQLTGAATWISGIQYDFEWVGFEHHPHTGEMYGCSSDAEVFLISADGSVDHLTQLELPCNNLAAPWDVPELPPIG